MSCGSVSRIERRVFVDPRTGDREQNKAAESSLFFWFWVAKFGIAPGSDSVQPGFAGSDPDRFLDIGNEDFAVADAPGLGGPADRVDRFLDEILADHDLDFDLGGEVHDVFRAPIEFGVPLLSSKALGFGDGDALQSDFLKRLLYLVELERLDDGFDFFDRAPPGHFQIAVTGFDVARWRRLVDPSVRRRKSSPWS